MTTPPADDQAARAGWTFADSVQLVRDVAGNGDFDTLTTDVLDDLLAEYDRRGTEQAELWAALELSPRGDTHQSAIEEARRLCGVEAENENLAFQARNRHDVIVAVAVAAGHENEFPGRGLVEAVDALRNRAEVLSGLLRGMARRVVERRAYIGALCSEYDDMRTELRRVLGEWDASDRRVAAVRALAGPA